MIPYKSAIGICISNYLEYCVTQFTNHRSYHLYSATQTVMLIMNQKNLKALLKSVATLGKPYMFLQLMCTLQRAVQGS